MSADLVATQLYQRPIPHSHNHVILTSVRICSCMYRRVLSAGIAVRLSFHRFEGRIAPHLMSALDIAHSPFSLTCCSSVGLIVQISMVVQRGCAVMVGSREAQGR